HGVRITRADNGQTLTDVFLDGASELWNRDRSRLTLLLDPARIKRGLVPHLEAGYPLQEGTVVVVSVIPAFQDAQGRPLQEPASRQSSVGPPIRARIDETRWHLQRPEPESRDPLVVSFDRPLDYALLDRALVVSYGGRALPGKTVIEPGESVWRFVPNRP